MKKVLSGIAAFVMALSGLLAVASPAQADYCSSRTPNGRLGVYSSTYCYGTMNTYGVYGSGRYNPRIRVTSVMNDSNATWDICRWTNFTGCSVTLYPGQRLSSVYALGWSSVGAISQR